MHRWKPACPLKKSVKTKWNINSDEGITLVELLAALVILSVVILLVGSVHIFGQRQFISQTESASQANDLSYSLSVISREVRKRSEKSENFTINENAIVFEEKMLFYFDEGNLYRNHSELLASHISDFSIDEIVENERLAGVEISLSSIGKGSKPAKSYHTTIYFRR